MSNRFQYTQRPAESWQQRSEQSAGGFVGFLKDNIKNYNPKAGDNCIRPLPPTWPAAKHYGYDIWVHYQIGMQKANLLCTLKMFNKPCPVCQRQAKLDADGRTDDAKAFRAVRRVLVWIVDRKEPGDKPLAWAMPWTVDRDITATCRDRQTGEIYYIDHPELGYDVSFEKKGAQLNTDYVGVQLARRQSVVEDKFLDYAIANPLPGILIERTYEEMLNYLDGGTEAPTPEGQTALSNQTTGATQALPPWQQPAPQIPTPQPEPQPLPPQMQQEAGVFCANTVSWQGQQIGCVFATGHQGPCKMERPIALPAPEPVPVAAAPREVVYAPPVQQPQVSNTPLAPVPITVAPPSGEPQSRASSLRARFENTTK